MLRDVAGLVSRFVSVAKDPTEVRRSLALSQRLMLARDIQQRMSPAAPPIECGFEVAGPAIPADDIVDCLCSAAKGFVPRVQKDDITAVFCKVASQPEDSCERNAGVGPPDRRLLAMPSAADGLTRRSRRVARGRSRSPAWALLGAHRS